MNTDNEKTENQLLDGEGSDAATCSVSNWKSPAEQPPEHQENVWYQVDGKVRVGIYNEGNKSRHSVSYFHTPCGLLGKNFQPSEVEAWKPMVAPDPFLQTVTTNRLPK